MAMHAPVVRAINDIPVTLSTDVAAYFGKDHRNVLKRIDAIRAGCGADRLLNFQQTVVTRENPSGGAPIESRAYYLTRDGFVFLTMGFTGKKAQDFKWAYIDAFNKMAAQIRHDEILAKGLTSTEAAAIHAFVYTARHHWPQISRIIEALGILNARDAVTLKTVMKELRAMAVTLNALDFRCSMRYGLT